MSLHHPDISLIGVPKSGTSSLHALLDSLPGICGSNPKETFFFMDPNSPLASDKASFHKDGVESYSRFFKHKKPGELTLDSTTHYFYQQTAIDEFAKSGTKVCVVLREPTSRLISYFQYVCLTRDAVKQPIDFGKFVHGLLNNDVESFREQFINEREFYTLKTCLTQGYYADYLEKWRAQIAPENLLVLLFEDLVSNQSEVLRKVVDFIGLPTEDGQLRLQKDNETYNAKYPGINRIARYLAGLIANERIKRPIRRLYLKFQKGGEVTDLRSQYPEVVDMIRQHYDDHIQRFADLSGLDISVWRKEPTKKSAEEQNA